MTTTFRSVCPYDCPDCCGLLVEVEDNKVIRVKGDPEHTFTRGTLCPKMVHYEETIHSPERLTTPLRRIGAKGEGKFEPITWDEAISSIASQWKRLINEYGAECIMPYSYAGTMGIIQKGAGRAFFYKLKASRQDRTICSPAKSHGWASVMGRTCSTRPQEAQRSDLIILWSLNAVATDIHFLHDVQAAKAKGAVIWAIDTHATSTLAQADRAIVVRPGSDGALALGLMHVIDRDGLADKDFLRDWTEGYDELQEKVLPRYTLEVVSQITGIAPEVIEELARAYAAARAPFIRLGSGLSRYGNGAMTVRCITCLPAVVGAWAKPGGGLLSSAGGSQFVGESAVTREDWNDGSTRLINMIEIGQALTELQDKPIKSLFIYSSHPAITAPDQNVVRQGLLREDLFTVVHERFMTETAKYADIVLPATSSVEHDDIYNSYGHYTIECGYQLIKPVGESRSNWQVFALLAKAMGMEEPFFQTSERDMIKKVLQTAKGLNDEEIAAILAGEPVEIRLPENYKLDIKTLSGKIMLRNDQEERPLPEYFEPHGDEAPLWLINPPDVRILDSSFNERDMKGQPTMILRMNPADASARQLQDGQQVVMYNKRGEVEIGMHLDAAVKPGTVVSPGVWWMRHSSDRKVSINALTAARTTDKAGGSTFYDVKVEVRAR